jgi:hypothetical protein
MLRRTRVVSVGLAIAAALAVPAVAQAKPQTATVLRLDRAHHQIELVNSRHVVRNYVIGTKVPRRVARGSVVAYTTRGKRVTKLRLKGRAHKISFYATVVSSGSKGVVLRLANGRRVRLGGKRKHAAPRIKAAGSVSVSVQGLKVGQTVMITETFDGKGNVSIVITLVQAPDPTGGQDQTDTGTVTAVAADGSTLTVQVDGKGPLTFQTDSDLVDGVAVGDVVDVTYYEDTGQLIADDVQLSDTSGTDNSGTDNSGTDNSGTDNSGTGNSGSDGSGSGD